MKECPVIGRREWIALPELGLSPLVAKTDTGARTSSLHAEDIHFDEKTGIVNFLTVANDAPTHPCSCRAIQIKLVRNSGGIAQSRIVIRTTLTFPSGITFTTDFTLADRRTMRYPVLLGRRALNGHFLIDPQHRHILGSF